MRSQTPNRQSAERRLIELEAEERYARERYQLYKAKAYGSRLTSAGRLRELERRSTLAKSRLDRARAAGDYDAADTSINRTPIRKERHMPQTITSDEVVGVAKGLGQAEFTRGDLAQKLGVDKSELKKGFHQARKAGSLDKVRDDKEGIGHFRLTDR